MIPALLLDAHGTLVELEPPAPVLRRALSEQFGVVVTPAGAEAAMAAEIAYYRQHLGEGRDARSVEELHGRCAAVLRAALVAAGHEGLEGIGAGDFKALLLASLRFRPYPEVAQVLGELRGRGLRMIVVSNWDASLPQTLGALGLLDLVDGVVTSAQCGVAKPGAGIFAAALELAGAPARSALHVGDSVSEDVAGARAVRIEPVLIVRDGGSPPPGVRTIRSLTELLGLPELAAG